MQPIIRTAAVVLLLSFAGNVLPDEIQITDGDRILNADLELAPGSTLGNGAILMLHGTLGHKDMEIIETLQTVFQEYGYNSIAINLSYDLDDRQGFYPCEQPHTHEYGDALKELDLWLAWLADQNAGDIVMLGHSRGANQLANFLLQTGHNIRAGILLAPSTNEGLVSADVLKTLDQASATEWLDETDFLHCKAAKVRSTSYRSYYESPGQGDTPALLNDIKFPVLVFSGSHDKIVSGLAQRMESVENSSVSYIEIDGADHFFRDLFAYDVVEASIEFLESLPIIKPAVSLSSDVNATAGSHKPIVIFVTRKGCQYCELLRDRVLHPMIKAGEINGKAMLREVSLNDDFSLEDFAGESVSGKEFAGRYDALLTPTVMFLDRNGTEITNRIVGISNIEFYGFYLDNAIADASEAIKESKMKTGEEK